MHFDYYIMRKDEWGEAYTLIVKDDLCGYVWLKDMEEAKYETTAKILLEWFAAFGLMQACISYQASHF